MKIITGYTGTNHISSDDDRHLYAGILGNGCYVLNDNGNQLGITNLGNNQLQIDRGGVVINGTHARIENPEIVTVPNGTVGMMRRDVIVARYTKLGLIENVELKVLSGTPATSNPQLPLMYDNKSGYNVLSGDTTVDFPLYEIVFNGVNIVNTISLFSNVRGVSANLDNIFDKIYPVGSIYMSVNNTNPSLLFGGTWVAWGGGRVPVGVGNNGTNNYANSDVVGGADKFDYTPSGTVGNTTLTENQIPKHSHNIKVTGVNLTQGGTTSLNVWNEGSGSPIMYTEEVGGNSPHNHTFTGSKVVQDNRQAYITCYMWKRTN